MANRQIFRRIPKTLLVASCVIFIVLGSVAIISRCRLSETINSIFKSGVGAEYQSWFEHLLSGFVMPSIMLIAFFPIWWVFTGKPKNHSKNRFVFRVRQWLMSQSERHQYDLWLCTCVLLDIAVSGNFEFTQFLVRGTFQWGQYGCDVAGSLIWFLLLKRLCPIPTLQRCCAFRLHASEPKL